MKEEIGNQVQGNSEAQSSELGDGIDRRGFLECMAWVGTGVICAVAGGVLSSRSLADPYAKAAPKGELYFAQISDSHIGFDKAANKDVVGTLKAAVDKINVLPVRPAFLIHTADLTHLAKPEEFDTVDQILKGVKTDRIFCVPGEHDLVDDSGSGKIYRERYGKGTKGDGWYSFDQKGVHFVGLVNTPRGDSKGLGSLGSDQLAWLNDDLRALKSSTPIVVFAHVPLWEVYPGWGWGTSDGAQALSALKRFGSVTVLNGHIHQTMQKVEGNVTFHTAASTAFPQPKPGTADAPGPMKVPDDTLRKVLGITKVSYVKGMFALDIVDTSLEG